MPSSPEKSSKPSSGPSPNPSPDTKTTPLKKKRHTSSWPELWLNHHHQQQHRQGSLKQAVLKMRGLQSFSNSTTPPSESDSETLAHNPLHGPAAPDYTSLLSDQLLLRILSKVPENQHVLNSLVCKRWCRLSGKLVKSIRLLDWDFLESGKLVYRFPNLIEVDITQGCVKSGRNSGILLSNRLVTLQLDSGSLVNGFVSKDDFLEVGVVDRGVKILAEGCGNLQRVVLMNVSEEGLKCLAEECETLQELELHKANDLALQGVRVFKNLQILKVIGCIDGVYDESVITDIGLTILAHGCRRLVKLELVGCEGSYDGIKAIGQCCQMLEELTLCDHRMDGGWLSALSYCANLKTLKLQSCRSIDSSPGSDEHLGCCPTLEELHLQRCQIWDKEGTRALFIVCQTVRELVFEDCWGLDNNAFAAASICRSVRYLSLEGCSLLTTEGLDSVVISWKELKRLRVVSCNNIKDSEITPELATLFSVLKELKWRPDSRSLLSAGLEGTGVGQKGGRYFG